MKKIMILIAMIFALGSLPAASYAGWTGGQSEPNAHRASNIIGSWVKNKKGDYLGRITDLMVDPQNGGMALAVLSRGGVLGIPMRFVAVPFHALTSGGDTHVYFLDMSKKKMGSAPGFEREHWPDVANRQWESDTYRYYGQTPQWGDSHEPRAPIWGRADRYYQIVGKSVKNQQGETVGKINDLVIDFQGHVPLALLTHGGFWGMGGKLVAVPLSALNFEQKEKAFVLNSSQEKLDSAPAFRVSDLSHKEWPEEVYRFFGQTPYWTQ